MRKQYYYQWKLFRDQEKALQKYKCILCKKYKTRESGKLEGSGRVQQGCLNVVSFVKRQTYTGSIEILECNVLRLFALGNIHEQL